MKLKIIIVNIFVWMVSTFILAQNLEKYNQLVNDAAILFENKQYLESAKKYTEAFSLNDKGLVKDRYYAAKSWALAEQNDAAFNELFKIADKGNFKDFSFLISDEDLNFLHSDKRWKELVELVIKNSFSAN